MSGELLPCPFCGAGGIVWKAFPGFGNPWAVQYDHTGECPLLPWEGVVFITKKDAIRTWNTRTPTKAPDHG